jgi:hypothetical protein
VSVLGATVPFSFYQLYSGINTLQVIFVDDFGNGKTSTITLTPGNYTAITVLDQLKTKLIAEAQISVGMYIGYTPTITFTYDSGTSLDTFAMTSPGGFASINMSFSTNLILGRFFGCNNNKFITSFVKATSDKPVVTNPVNKLFIRSSTLKQLGNREYVVEKNTYSDILYTIYINTGQNTWIQSNIESNPVFITNESLSNINFYLTSNLDYLPVDLEGLNWEFQFKITEVSKVAYTPRQLAINLLESIPLSEQEEPTDNKFAERTTIAEQ